MARPVGTTTTWAIVLAAGGGTRFGGAVPKQLAEFRGVPLASHSLALFQGVEQVDRIVLAAAPGMSERLERLVADGRFDKVARVVEGGERRQDSVARAVAAIDALEGVTNADRVLVHDAARPLATAALVERVLAALERHSAVIPVVPLHDTVKQIGTDGGVEATIPRPASGGLHAAQTPQGFRLEALRRACAAAADQPQHHSQGSDAEPGRGGGLRVPSAADDAELVARAGVAVATVAGDPINIKITIPADIGLAAALAATAHPDELEWRHGAGADAHRLAAPGPLILGGVEIPFDKGLEGHSDGDALMHCVADAVLGGAGCGDLGRHFPATPEWRDAAGARIVAAAAAIAREAGWSVTTVDATAIAQRPRLAEYLNLMQGNIAAALGIGPGAVNVKATSTDGLGLIGTGEGIAVQALATLRRTV